MYRQHFGLSGHLFPQDVQGKALFETPTYAKLQKRFQYLSRNPGIGILTAESGVGKTAAIRNLSLTLPRPDYKVIYLCDTFISPIELYRQIALEIGLTPCHRRGQLWRELKKTLLHMVDEQSIKPVLLIDEAQHLCDRFLADLSGFLNFAMDSRNLITLWLVGLPTIRPFLRMKRNESLASRICASIHLEPLGDRKQFEKFLQHGLKAAGASTKLFADSVIELLFRASRGIPRRVSYLVREALMMAHEQDKTFADDAVMEAVLDQEDLP